MTSKDFIYLNVPALLKRYSNPSPNWKEIVIAWTQTEIEFYRRQGLLRADVSLFERTPSEAVVMFSDFTSEGQDFIKSKAVDNWLKSCDRKGVIEAYKDASGLEHRLRKFRGRVVRE